MSIINTILAREKNRCTFLKDQTIVKQAPLCSQARHVIYLSTSAITNNKMWEVWSQVRQINRETNCNLVLFLHSKFFLGSFVKRNQLPEIPSKASFH